MNNKLSLSLAALTAVGLFAIYSAPAFAAFNPAGVPPGGGGGTPPGGGTPVCVVDCGGDSTEPGDPFLPPPVGEVPPPDGEVPPPDGDIPPPDGDIPPPDGDVPPPGGDPEYPTLTKAEGAELRACLARLDGLPQVSETQVNQFGQPYKVTLNPVCEAKSLTDVQPILVEGGNVAGLEPAIKGNAAIKSKLGESAYKARDVVGIDFDTKGNAILFVHKRG